MDLGVGLPSTIPAATAADILNWAREADAGDQLRSLADVTLR